MYVKKPSFYFVWQYTRLITCILSYNTQEIISYKIYKSALRLVSEISYAMTLSVRLCLSLFMTEIAFKWVFSRIASPSRTAMER